MKGSAAMCYDTAAQSVGVTAPAICLVSGSASRKSPIRNRTKSGRGRGSEDCDEYGRCAMHVRPRPGDTDGVGRRES
jgi:hypothetical protein